MKKKPAKANAKATKKVTKTDFGPTLEAILSAFREGRVAAPLAQVFIKKRRHAERWGLFNQWLVALYGMDDAATYLQWQDMGRQVRGGTKNGGYLIQPNKGRFEVLRKNEDGQEEPVMVEVIRSFSYFPVFSLADTDPIPGFKRKTYEELYPRVDEQALFDRLPLVEVARAWGIKLATYGGEHQRALGFMRPGELIALGVENLSTWAHELCHEADSRAGNLTRKGGQDRLNEFVAELGGCVLLTMLGLETEADWGGAYEYIRGYAKKKDPEGMVKEIRDVVWRIGAAVSLIIETAEQLEDSHDAETDGLQNDGDEPGDA